MSDTQNDPAAFVREQVEAIISGGESIRFKVSELVTGTAEKFHLDKDGLLGLSRSVMDGTTAAVDKAVSHDPESVLRQVVDGLGDGLAAAALASRLAVEEAQAQQKAFATEDLKKLNTDLRDLGAKFVDTVAGAFTKFRTITSAQLTALREHAMATRQRLQPSLEAALGAAGKQPLQLGQESVAAGLSLSVHALGALFGAIGKSMEEAGKMLTGDKPRK